MDRSRRTSRAAACGASALLALSGAAAHAQTSPATTPPSFAPPVRLERDGAFLGATRLYPSPVIHDVNGDGAGDLVLGDLWGNVTVSLRDATSATPRFGAETPIPASDGSELKFNNW